MALAKLSELLSSVKDNSYAITTEKDAEKKNTEMGRKCIVPYGLYRAEGYISANLARKVTGFSEDDLELLWEAIINMFENDHSAARGKMAVRELIVFKHSKELGDCPAYKLFDSVEVMKKDNVEYPRKYQDYEVHINRKKISNIKRRNMKVDVLLGLQWGDEGKGKVLLTGKILSLLAI